MSRPDFQQAVTQMDRAVDDTYHADPEAYIATWSTKQPVSLFGALGPAKTGPADVHAALRWVAARFSDSAMTTAYEVVDVGADMAYTVGYEHGQVAVDGRKQAVTIRVTHIYRLEDGAWRLVHRHGDFAPQDTSPNATGQKGMP
jgi:ketosteroid isomerase-like protein